MLYRWDKKSGGITPPTPQFTDVKYSQYAPNWETLFLQGKEINGPVSRLPKHEEGVLKSLGVVSAFVFPIIIDYALW
jgi:hypothetical protein